VILPGSSREGQSFFSGHDLLSSQRSRYICSACCPRMARKSFGRFCFLGEIAHFLKFSSTADSAQPNHLRLLLPFGGEVSSVVFQKAARGIFWDFRHPNGLLTIRKHRGKQSSKKIPFPEQRITKPGNTDSCEKSYNLTKRPQNQRFSAFPGFAGRSIPAQQVKAEMAAFKKKRKKNRSLK